MSDEEKKVPDQELVIRTKWANYDKNSQTLIKKAGGWNNCTYVGRWMDKNSKYRLKVRMNKFKNHNYGIGISAVDKDTSTGCHKQTGTCYAYYDNGNVWENGKNYAKSKACKSGDEVELIYKFPNLWIKINNGSETLIINGVEEKPYKFALTFHSYTYTIKSCIVENSQTEGCVGVEEYEKLLFDIPNNSSTEIKKGFEYSVGVSEKDAKEFGLDSTIGAKLSVGGSYMGVAMNAEVSASITQSTKSLLESTVNTSMKETTMFRIAPKKRLVVKQKGVMIKLTGNKSFMVPTAKLDVQESDL